MPKIVFFCPPAPTINGGIKYIFRMAECLRSVGYDAMVLEEHERRPTWFAAPDVPIVGQSALKPDPDQIYVLPEDQTHMLAPLKDWPQQKIIYVQNHFYSAYRLEDLKSYADYGIRHMLCSSRTILEHARLRHPGVAAHLVPYAIDTGLFRPSKKQNRIAFMPRKRAIEAAYIRDLFRFLHSAYRDWQWQELSNLSEAEIAKAMSEANVFLSLSRLEGFGLTPLEAMAAGCIVAGFTGIGGREYATAKNGFWAEEDDFPGCIAQLKAALDLAQKQDSTREAYTKTCQETLAAYTPEIFRHAVTEAWGRILA
jgi:glycosyltransferase involved in cell wall biosynthesis